MQRGSSRYSALSCFGCFAIVLGVIIYTTQYAYSQYPPGYGGGYGPPPALTWTPAFPSDPTLAGSVPMGVPGAFYSAPYGWCFNGPIGWEVENCGEKVRGAFEVGSCGTCGLSGETIKLSSPPSSMSLWDSVAPGVPLNSSMVSFGKSVIDNLRFSYMHWADDYAPGEGGGVSLRRFTKTRSTYIKSSLGPDGFLNFDMKMRLVSAFIWDENDPYFRQNELFASIYLFDPSKLEEVRLMRVSASKLIPVQRSRIRDALLYDAQMQLVTSTTGWGGAKFSKLTMLNGVEFWFEIVNADPDPSQLTGRFIQHKEPSGITNNITYKSWTPTQIAESPSRLLQIDKVTDSYNRVMTFTYYPNQIGGRWCVNSVALPDGTQVTYNFGGNYLQSVAHADGTTTTITYSIPPNAAGDIMSMDIFDPVASPSHRKKSVILAGGVQLVGNTIVPVAVDHVRGVKNGAGEFTYLNFMSDVNGDELIHVYEGGGRMKRVLNYNNQIGYLLDGWTMTGSYGVNGTVENEYQQNEIDFYRTIAHRDDTGNETEYKYDTEGRRIYTIYSDNTFEAYCYGSNLNVTRYRDREGNVTKAAFDANGNRTSQQVGLRDNASNTGTTFDPVTGMPIYDRCATNDVQTADYAQMSWQYDSMGRVLVAVDANGNQTNYAYYPNGSLQTITQPADVANGTRAQTSFVYDNAGRKVSETDPTGNVTQFFYNPVGKPTKIQYPDGTTEEIVYGTSGNAIGLPVKKIDRGGIVTEMQYDAAERMITRINASAIKQGNTETPTPSLAMTETWTYLNGTDDPIEHRQAGALRKYVYDYRGRLVKTIQYPRSGVELVSKSTYIDNRLFSQQDPYGRKTFYGYDATDGRMIRTVKGTVPTYSLTTFAAVMAVTRNLAANSTFIVNDMVYDSDGRLESQFDARGTETRFEYDSRGRQKNSGKPMALPWRPKPRHSMTRKAMSLRFARHVTSTPPIPMDTKRPKRPTPTQDAIA